MGAGACLRLWLPAAALRAGADGVAGNLRRSPPLAAGARHARQRGADGLPAHRLLFHLLSAGAGPRRHARVLATCWARSHSDAGADGQRFDAGRVSGLLLALAGLIMVFQSIALARYSAAGIGFALAALLSMTAGAIPARRQPPMDVMPLQCAVSLVLCLLRAVPALVGGLEHRLRAALVVDGAGDLGGRDAAVLPHDPGGQRSM